MRAPVTRRQFVATAATLAVAVPGVADETTMPTILVKPYVQPGDGSGPSTADVKVLCWLTDPVPGDFVVEYDVPGKRKRTANVERIALDFAKAPEEKKATTFPSDDPHAVPPEHTAKLPPEREQHYFKYVARLSNLPFDSEIRYRVKLGDLVIREAAFRTRASADQSVRLGLVGDLANGKPHQNAIAYRISEQKPEFLLALGDLTYPAGRVSQYLQFFWKTYNDVEKAGVTTGAPLMASVPIYPVLGNHDVAAKLPRIPDAFGAYYFFHTPKNGPGIGPWVTPLGSDRAMVARFREATADSYPAMDAYSFDYGPGHFLMLNSNMSGNVDQPKLREWVEADLQQSKSRWKFACYHNPAFSSSHQHYTEQSVRGWHPIFEAAGVDLVFCGHVHNYQRTRPLKFAPTSPKRDKRGRLDGTFTLDNDFDGQKKLRPRGIIHIVAGGGGATLYGPGLQTTANTLRKEHGNNYADFTAKMVTDRHSFVILDMTPDRLTLRTIDINGKELDGIHIEKNRA